MRIFSYILILCLIPLINLGQPEKKIAPKRTDNFVRMKGLRVGMDMTRPFQRFWNKGNRYGTELSFDIELKPNLFPVFETGWEALKINSDYVDYRGSGNYSRLGFDYNFLVAQSKEDKNMLFIGLRYGFALAKQDVERFLINSYWGDYSSNFQTQKFYGHWGEFLLGLKGEVLKNIYLGWTVRGKVKFNTKAYTLPPIYFMPGYGKAEKGFNLDFTYSVFYNLPLDFRKSKHKK